jgi:indole-3-glycerol phosphate synthase
MLRACGFNAFLVGETLMRSGQPEETLRALIHYREGRARGGVRRG